MTVSSCVKHCTVLWISYESTDSCRNHSLSTHLGARTSTMSCFNVVQVGHKCSSRPWFTITGTPRGIYITRPTSWGFMENWRHLSYRYFMRLHHGGEQGGGWAEGGLGKFSFFIFLFTPRPYSVEHPSFNRSNLWIFGSLVSGLLNIQGPLH